jgi:hypothetical protein
VHASEAAARRAPARHPALLHLKRPFTVATLAVALLAPAASADVVSELRDRIQRDSAAAAAVQPRLDDLTQRLGGLQASLDIQQTRLSSVQGELRTARRNLARLRVQLAADRQALASQLVAQYKDPAPTLVTVVLNAHGFRDLIETTRSLSNVARQNAEVTKRVGVAEDETAREEHRLAGLERRRSAETAAVLAERDEVASIRGTILQRYTRLTGDRAAARAKLKKLEAQFAPTLTGGAAAGGSGFFQAPGTNYTVGDEPELARRLNAMGIALGLHLIGLSGYRTPEHSVEVGGFPNDPHTRGEASDTPGVEGVPEATLNHYGLTRPFGGTAELDHIQLVGSI